MPVSQSTQFLQVQAINALTFHGATGYQQRGGNIAYVYAFPQVEFGVGGLTTKLTLGVGTDRDHNNDYTNVNTLIVRPDCTSVVTSFPGLPSDLSPNDSRISGTPVWTQTFIGLPRLW